MSDDKKILRSTAWFGGHDKDAFIHRSWMKNQGLPDHLFDGRPGHRHLQHLVRADALQRPFPRTSPSM